METRSISALRTWPSEELTVSLPSPAASAASEAPSRSASATALLFILIVFPSPPRRPVKCSVTSGVYCCKFTLFFTSGGRPGRNPRLQQDAQHPPQRLRGAPQELVPD